MKILSILFCLIVFVSCDSNGNSEQPSTPSYQETKMTLEDQEKANPLSFIKITGTYRKNIVGQWVFEGSVTNSATLATYKDVVLRIVYYSKTDTEIGTEDKTVFEYFKPGSTQNFKIKSNGYEGAKKAGFQILSASAVD